MLFAAVLGTYHVGCLRTHHGAPPDETRGKRALPPSLPPSPPPSSPTPPSPRLADLVVYDALAASMGLSRSCLSVQHDCVND